MTSTWSVDPDRVAGVIRAVDDQGALMETGATAIRTLAIDSGDELITDGRTRVYSAWAEFWEMRRQVPGKVMFSIAESIRGVAAASNEVINGDEQMDAAQVSLIATTEWRVPPTSIYNAHLYAPGDEGTDVG